MEKKEKKGIKSMAIFFLAGLAGGVQASPHGVSSDDK